MVSAVSADRETAASKSKMAVFVGRTPAYAPDPLVRLKLGVADGGVGRGPGGPPRILNKRIIERPREQIFQANYLGLAVQVGESELDVAAKLPQNLPARATGWG